MPAKKILKNCLGCGQQRPIRPDRTFCSSRCWYDYSTVIPKIDCRSCGVRFQPQNKATKFCGWSCVKRWYATHRNIYTCQQCGITFESRFIKHAPKFCSKRCKDESRKLGDRPPHTPTKVSKNCERCGRLFWFYESVHPRGRRFCSQSCSFRARRKGPTSIELAVRGWLTEMGVIFEVEFQFGRYLADTFLPDCQLIIECDGTYWHSSEKSKDRDRRKTLAAKQRGWRVLRLPQALIEQDPTECRRQIVKELKRSGQLPLPV